MRLISLTFMVLSISAAATAQVIVSPVHVERVGYRDLNLQTNEGVQTLVTRIRSATKLVCRDSSEYLNQKGRCQQIAWNSAEPQLKRAIRNATSTREVASIVLEVPSR